MPDLALNLFLSLGGHVELPDDRSFISPMPGYVENKAGDAETLYVSTKSPLWSRVSITCRPCESKGYRVSRHVWREA